MHFSSLTWLIVGAIAGLVIVFLAHTVAGVQMEGWLAAIITTVTATVVVSIGPTEAVRVEEKNYPVATA